MNILAVIPARIGSKRLPRKNLALIDGQPLTYRAWRTASAFRERHPYTRLVLSTDSEEIANTWPETDRPSRLRPSRLSQDNSSTLEVVRFELGMTRGEIDLVLVLQPTSPLITADDIERLLARHQESGRSVFGVNSAGVAVGVYLTRTSDIANRNIENPFTGDPVLIPDERAIDINTGEDLEAARAYVERQWIVAVMTATTGD